MRTLTLISGVIATLLAVVACDGGSKDEETKADAAKSAPPAEDGGEATGTAPPAAAALSFDEALEKQGCDVLTAAVVGKTFELPENALEQLTVAGCIYSWDSETEELYARLASVRVHDDVDKAEGWFENSTKDMSQAEIAAAMGEIKKKATEDGKIDTAPKKRAADEIGGAITQMAGADGYTFEDIEGVGDAAAVSGDDGAVTVLLGNMTFSVTAYKGAKQPPLQIPSNPKQIAAAAKKANAAWMAKTLDQRQAQSTKLAKAVVLALRERG